MLRTSPHFRLMLIPLLVVVALIALLNGCSFLQKPDNAVLQQVAVQYGTAKFVEGKPVGAERIERATQIKSVALLVQSVASADNATVSTLQEFAAAKIAAAHLSPPDAILANALVSVIVAELNVRVADGVLNAENRVIVNRLLGWVIDAAGAYIPAVAS